MREQKRIVGGVMEIASSLPTEEKFTTKEMALMTGDPRLNSPNMLRTLHWMGCIKPVAPPKSSVQTIWQKVFDPNDPTASFQDGLIKYCYVCKYRESKKRQPGCIILDRYKK